MQTHKRNKIETLSSSLFNCGLLAGLAVLVFGLASCGGDSSSTSAVTASTTPTITSITPAGIVASSVPQALSILGSNFTNALSLTIANSSGVPYTITSSSVTSSTVLTANVTISSAPTDNYASVTLQPATGTAATAVLGVAGSHKTVANGIQTIFSAKCAGCHTGSSAGGLDLSDATLGNSTGVIGINSLACSSKFRVVPGDPRRSSSVLIDRIKAAPATQACNTNKPMPPAGSTALTAQEIADIIDWVAAGAN